MKKDVPLPAPPPTPDTETGTKGADSDKIAQGLKALLDLADKLGRAATNGAGDGASKEQ